MTVFDMQMIQSTKKINEPSKVLLFKNIPDDFLECQVVGLCEPFGQVTHSILLRQKRRALVEFQNVRMAVQCYTFFKDEPCCVDGITLSIGFSAKKEIGEGNPPNKIVDLEISNIAYPLTKEIVAQIFKPFLVKKICYREDLDNDKCYAIVELDDIESGVAAFYKLQNRNIYADCCNVRVKYSSYTSLDSVPDATSVTDLIQTKRIALMFPVCILHGLHDTLTKPEDLAAIFQCYGEVVRIKIFYNNRAIGLVQMSTIESCHKCIQHLNGFILHGQKINVEPSKGKPIPPPAPQSHDVSEGERLTMDFYQYGNAYRGPVSRPHLMLEAGSPSCFLKVSDPAEQHANKILKIFEKYQIEIQSFAYPAVEFFDIATATQALITCHRADTGAGPLFLTFA